MLSSGVWFDDLDSGRTERLGSVWDLDLVVLRAGGGDLPVPTKKRARWLVMPDDATGSTRLLRDAVEDTLEVVAHLDIY